VEVLFVTNLNDSGPGSLRDAIGRADPNRLSVVVFRTGGTVTLSGMLRFSRSCLYVAGQTAPGGGIQLRYPDGQGSHVLWIEPDGSGHDVVLRYLRIRSGKGEPSKGDNLAIRGGHNIMIDHLSLEWANDESVDISSYPDRAAIQDVTLQRSIVAETLNPHSTGFLINGAPSDDRPPISRIAIHHNLFAQNSHRNPLVAYHKGIKVVNNVVHNSRSRVGRTRYDPEIDYIGNYYQRGPWTAFRRVPLQHESWASSDIPSVYLADNIADWMQVADNRDLIRFDTGGPLPAAAFRSGPIASAPVPITIQSAQAAFASVLYDVGANARLDCHGRWVPNADAVDTELTGAVHNRTGPATDDENDHPDDYGGYPVLAAGTPSADGDQDGMPAAFETAYGLDPAIPADNRLDGDGDGYTNLEEYLNGTTP
jgi:hypothetical protein